MSDDKAIVDSMFSQLVMMEKLEAGDNEYFQYCQDLLKMFRMMTPERVEERETVGEELYREIIR